MAAPVLANRSVCFVNKVGTDDAGYNAVGAPNSKLTIAAALADLAANYPAASAINPHIVAVGPGFFAVAAAILIPPWTYIVGACDGQGRPNTTLSLADGTADIGLSAGWTADATARGGIGNVILLAASGTPIIDFTMPTPVAGNPARTVEVFNVQHALTQMIFEATSTADVWEVQDLIQNGVNTDVITQTGGTSRFNNVVAAALTTIQDKALFATLGVWQGVVISDAASGVRVITTVAAGCTLRMTGGNVRALTMDETAPGVIAVQADAVSIPLRAAVTYVGTAVTADLVRLTDADGVGYIPGAPADWPAPDPTTVQEALDMLAAAGGASPANGYATANNAAGNTTITPDAHNYEYFLTVTVADARTSVAILDIAGRLDGDTIHLNVQSLIAGVTIEFRDATAVGTLLDSWSTTDASGFFTFVFAAGAWIRQSGQVPA